MTKEEIIKQCPDLWEIVCEYYDEEEAVDIINNKDYEYYDEVYDAYDLGQYLIDYGLCGEIYPEVKDFIDYEAFGYNRINTFKGGFTKNGYVKLGDNI